MIYGYCRCSTNESKQDLNRQIRELKELGATDMTIYKEYESGTKLHRPELEKLLNIVRSGDTIVVTEISRITRSTKQLKLIIKDSLTIDCSSGTLNPMTAAFLQMSGVFAELERNIISERVKSGMRNAKAKGRTIGRPALKYEDIPQKVINNYNLYIDGKISKTDYAKICNVSRPTLDKYIKIIKGE